MIPISLIWDSGGKSLFVKWNGFFCVGWERGEEIRKVFKIPIPHGPGVTGGKGVRLFQKRWIGLKEAHSFIKAWRLKRAEGTFSFEDPMVNGVLYGWVSAFVPAKEKNRKINLSVNFIGENRCSGEVTISPKVVFHHLIRWFLLYLKKGRKLQKGG